MSIFGNISFAKYLNDLPEKEQKECMESICQFSRVVKAYLKMQKIAKKTTPCPPNSKTS
jgi:hypothetical protein